MPKVQSPLKPEEDGASSPPRQGTAPVNWSPRIKCPKRPNTTTCMPSAEGSTHTKAPKASAVPPVATTSGPPECTTSTPFSAGRCATQKRKTRSFPLRGIRKEQANRKGQTLGIAQATARISQLKSIIRKDPDPPSIAAEMAMLYLVLSEHNNALKSFRLAIAPSPGKPFSCEEK